MKDQIISLPFIVCPNCNQETPIIEIEQRLIARTIKVIKIEQEKIKVDSNYQRTVHSDSLSFYCDRCHYTFAATPERLWNFLINHEIIEEEVEEEMTDPINKVEIG
jgi:hypothetical protein